MAEEFDMHLAATLAQTGLVFSFDEDGNASCEVETEDGRTQFVFVRAKFTGWPDHRCRRIYACAYVGREDLPRRVVDSLLAQNSDSAGGAWETIQDGGDLLLLFTVHLSVAAPPAILRSAIEHVARTADARESELSQSDGL